VEYRSVRKQNGKQLPSCCIHISSSLLEEEDMLQLMLYILKFPLLHQDDIFLAKKEDEKESIFLPKYSPTDDSVNTI